MAFVRIKEAQYIHSDGGGTGLEKLEFLIDSGDDLTDLPDCLPGSVAYTADLLSMYMFNGSTWTRIGG